MAAEQTAPYAELSICTAGFKDSASMRHYCVSEFNGSLEG